MEETRNMPDASQQNYVDIFELFRILKQRRKVFYWVLPITFVVSVALILCVPRRYTCEVILAPEVQNAGSAGSLQSLASSFGFDMRSMTSSDAIYPQIYPEVVGSPDFLTKLFNTPVTTADGGFEGTYYEYLLTKHKHTFWTRWKAKLAALLAPKEAPVEFSSGKQGGIDVFCMSKVQWYVLGLMKKSITCSVDKKTEVITIRVTAQDKLVSALIADSACTALQSFVTEYRTQKARSDIQYYEDVMHTALLEYQEACDKYIRYVDGHSGMKLEQYRLEAQNLETEMQIKQAAYTSFQKQYLATQARLQENTPVYTILQSASIPVKASGPKRMIFVLAMLILATGVTCCVLWKDILIKVFL